MFLKPIQFPKILPACLKYEEWMNTEQKVQNVIYQSQAAMVSFKSICHKKEIGQNCLLMCALFSGGGSFIHK